jgi:hypothetical protein
MRFNLPVSNLILHDFYHYTKNLPQGIKRFLMKKQLANSLQTPAGILRALNRVSTKYNLRLDKIIRALIDSTDYREDDAITLLNMDGSIPSKQKLFGIYLNKGDYLAASEILDDFRGIEHPYLTGFVTLNQKILTLYQNNKTIYDIDSVDLVYINELARQCPPSPAVYQARAIIEIITGIHIPACPKSIGLRSISLQETNNTFAKLKPALGDNYPDPFSDYTTIPYNLQDNIDGEIIIKDVLGKTIKTVSVNPETNLLRLNTNHWAKGIYYYSLKVNNEIIDTKKMVITK